MKKFYLLVIFCLATIFTASAEPVKYYFMYFVGDTENFLGGWFILDREKMTYEPESDSEVLNQVKNYKKTGNKETFEVWEDTYFVHRAEIVTDENGQMVITHYFKSEQGEEKDTPRIIATEAEWEKEYEKKYGKKPYRPGDEESGDAAVSSPTSGIENAKNKVTGGVKNAFNKTKDLFKKKDK